MKISGECMECYPCQHTVIINGESIGMSGDEIYSWHVERGLPVPEHFQIYKNLVESRKVRELIFHSRYDELSVLSKETIEDAFGYDTPMTQACSVSLEMVHFFKDKFDFPFSDQCFISAVKSGNLDVVKYLVGEGVSLNCGYCLAASNSHVDILRFFEESLEITDSVRIDALFKSRDANVKEYISKKIDPEFLQLAQKVPTLTNRECITLLSSLDEQSERYEYLLSHFKNLIRGEF